MTLPFNYETLNSSFDKRSTLLNQLKDMEDTFAAAGLTGIEVVDETATSLKLKMTFADGSSFTTNAIDLKGAKGDTGDPATVAVGTVTTGAAGSDATVTNVGTETNAVFDFSIPRGDTGAAGGITNMNGYTGAVNTGNGLTFNNGALSSYDFNLVDTGSVNLSQLSSTIFTNLWGNVQYALNSDKSIGKIYGRFGFKQANVSNDDYYSIDLGIIVAQPENTFTINPGSLMLQTDGSIVHDYHFSIDTNGHVYLSAWLRSAENNTSFNTFLPACIYFFKDFGDTPDNRALPLRMAALNSVENEER